MILVFGGAVFPFLLEAKALEEGKKLVTGQCVGCHRIEGPMPRSPKNAPDLIWAGSKYQRPLLVDWRQNPQEKLYPVGYDSNFKRKGQHLSLRAAKAERVADFLATLKDQRVQEGLMKPGTANELA